MLASANNLLYVSAMTDTPPAPWEQNFISEMKRIRLLRNMTQTDLARELQRLGLKFHQQTIQRIETGERPVRLNEAHLIANALEAKMASMEAAVSPSIRDLRYTLDHVRRIAISVALDLQDMAGEYEDALAELLVMLDDRNIDYRSPDPISQRALSFASHAYGPLRNLVDAMVQLRKVAGHWDPADLPPSSPADEIPDMVAMAHIDPDVADLTPQELYEEIGQADGEHPEEG